MFYKKHIFFCVNKKSDDNGCGFLGADDAFSFVKMYLQGLDMWGEGKIRASKSACLGRCSDGPVCVVYPDGVWYSYIDEVDVKEIIESHLLTGVIVDRLKIE